MISAMDTMLTLLQTIAPLVALGAFAVVVVGWARHDSFSGLSAAARALVPEGPEQDGGERSATTAGPADGARSGYARAA